VMKEWDFYTSKQLNLRDAIESVLQRPIQ